MSPRAAGALAEPLPTQNAPVAAAITALTADPAVPAPREPVPVPAPGRVLRVRPAPRREPPFDDELYWTATGPQDQPLPFPLHPAPVPVRPVAIANPARLPEPARWSHSLLVGLREVAAGHRPISQLSTLFVPGITASLGAELHRLARQEHRHWTARARVHSVHASRPRAGVAEVCATLQAGERMHAVALRLEERHGRWWCTRLQLG